MQSKYKLKKIHLKIMEDFVNAKQHYAKKTKKYKQKELKYAKRHETLSLVRLLLSLLEKLKRRTSLN